MAPIDIISQYLVATRENNPKFNREFRELYQGIVVRLTGNFGMDINKDLKSRFLLNVGVVKVAFSDRTFLNRLQQDGLGHSQAIVRTNETAG